MKLAFIAWAAPAVAIAACSPTQYTPPTRMIALDSPIGPAAGHTDVQGSLGTTGEIFGPSLVSAQGRVRQAVTDAVVLEAEGGVLHVTNEGGYDNPDRNTFTGRVGAMLRSADQGDLRGALSAGIGTGYSAATGGWAGFDVGASVAIRSSKYIRPFAGVDLGWSRPFSQREFTVSDASGDSWDLVLQPTLQTRMTLGIELGPKDEAAIIGASIVKPYYTNNATDTDSSGSGDANDDVFVSLGLGFRLEL